MIWLHFFYFSIFFFFFSYFQHSPMLYFRKKKMFLFFNVSLPSKKMLQLCLSAKLSNHNSSAQYHRSAAQQLTNNKQKLIKIFCHCQTIYAAIIEFHYGIRWTYRLRLDNNVSMAYFGLIEMETTAIETRTKSATALNYINELDVVLHLKNTKTKTIRRRNAEKKRFRAKKKAANNRDQYKYMNRLLVS